MLEKYKLCPVCGKKNYPGLIECIDCEQDLTQVRITDGTAEEERDGALVRICDNCSAKNPPNARKCAICGEDIADILPTPDAIVHDPTPIDPTPIETPVETPVKPTTPDSTAVPATVLNTKLSHLAYTVTLETLDHGYSYTLDSERTVLGRSESAKDYLSTKPYVSRVHCVITVSEDGVYLEDLNNTNYTFVNNTRATGRVKLANGDELSLGGMTIGGNRQSNAAYFKLEIV